MARTLARTLDLEFRRVQFTPDLMPSDITGTDVIEEDPETHRHKMEFMPGPIFANFLLADEINRTPPKTQAALLQAMQEQEVSIGRRTHRLKPPFYVVATQNPIEMEGTYPLPEAQLDRFMFNVRVEYPSLDEEVQIVKGTTSTHVAEAAPVLKAEELLRLQELVRGVPIADDVVRYAARLVAASRPRRVAAADGHPQVHRLRGQPPRLAVPGAGRQRAGDPRGPIPCRFRRYPCPGGARAAASPRVELPRPRRRDRQRRDRPPAAEGGSAGGEVSPLWLHLIFPLIFQRNLSIFDGHYNRDDRLR